MVRKESVTLFRISVFRYLSKINDLMLRKWCISFYTNNFSLHMNPLGPHRRHDVRLPDNVPHIANDGSGDIYGQLHGRRSASAEFQAHFRRVPRGSDKKCMRPVG